jgi:hypothetical protein
MMFSSENLKTLLDVLGKNVGDLSDYVRCVLDPVVMMLSGNLQNISRGISLCTFLINFRAQCSADSAFFFPDAELP